MEFEKCIICEEEIVGWAYTAEPLMKGDCCAKCWSTKVLRLRNEMAKRAAMEWKKNESI